jgi:hypothetical protein
MSMLRAGASRPDEKKEEYVAIVDLVGWVEEKVEHWIHAVVWVPY